MADPKYSEISEVYWFASYIYGEVKIPLGSSPTYSHQYVHIGNSEAPSVTDYIEDETMLGEIGFGITGHSPFQPAPAEGKAWPFRERNDRPSWRARRRQPEPEGWALT